MDFRMQDRMELKALVDFYATESDKNNQERSTNQTLG